jgi:hypothetical protein
MKKTITITCLLLSIFALNAQISFKEIQQKLPKQYQKLNFQKAKVTNRGAAVCLPDSVITYTLADNGVDSIVASKVYSTYNSNGDLTKQTNYELNNDVLSLFSETRYTYNAQNVLINEESYSLDFNNELILNNCTKYYPKGNSTTELDSIVTFETSLGQFNRTDKTEYTYDASGLLTKTISYDWDESIGWIPTNKQEFAYSASNKPISFIEFEWNDPNWDAVNQTDYTYDSLDSLTQFVSTDLLTNQATTRAILTYNTAENSTNTLIEIWDGSAWVLLFNTFLDNSTAGQIEQLDAFFDLPGFFTFGNRSVYVFPSGNDCAAFSNLYISENNIDWIYLGRAFYYYNGSTIPTNTLINNGLELKTTPNPFTNNLIVSTEIDSEIKVYSTTGTLLLESKSKDENTVLNTETLPIGTYFIVVNKNGKSERKMVVKG